MIKTAFTLLLCFLAFFANAQHPYYYNIGSEQDLPSSEIYQIKQDNFGYIWIGCDAGLFRYDGFRFKQYSNSRMTGRSISDLKFDPFGGLWCKNFNGQILKVSGDSLLIAIDYSKKCGSPFYTFSADGNIWTACQSKVTVYNQSLKLVKELDLSSTATNPNVDIVEIGYFKDKIYCARALNGVFSIDTKQYSLKKVSLSSDMEYLKKNFRALFSYTKEEAFIVIEVPDGSKRYSKIHQLRNDSLIYIREIVNGAQNHIIYQLKANNNNELWICSSSGAFPLKSVGDSINTKQNILPEQRISDMLQDREGNYWFTTLQNGLYVIPSLSVLRYIPDNCPALKIPQLTRLHAASDKTIWIGAYNGNLMNLQPKNRSISTHFNELHLPHRAVKNFYETEDYLFVSRNSNSAILKKDSSKAIRVLVGEARCLVIKEDSIFALLPSKLIKFYPANRYLKEGIPFDSMVSLSEIGGWSIAYDSTMQTIWLTLSSGLHIYKDGQLKPVLNEGKPIFGGYADYSNGIVWVSGLNTGLYGFEKGELKYHFTTENGLRNNSTKAVEAYKNYVWVTAANFLHRIRIPDGKVDVFSKNLGIYAKDIEDIEILNDTVYLATHKGLVQFPLELEADNNIAPNIAIESILLANEAISKEELLCLPYRHGQLLISFSATAFRSRGDFRYEYRLVGLDSNWATLSAENNFVGFSAIPPGSYRFEVRAVNESGLSSRVVATLNLRVLTPIWQQWWFILLLALGFVGLVFLFYNVRMRALTKRMQMERQLSASQLTALKAQMNPHFMYNALNSIQDLILTNDVRNANLYLNKFSTLMRRILKASDNDEILLEEESAILQLYLDLEKLRFGDDFSYEFIMDAQIKPDCTYIASMIIQPFIENAVKHGLLHKKGEKKLSISFKKEKEGLLLCSIIDNGVGRKRAAEIKERGKMQHQSFATKATEKRLEILNNSSKTDKIGLEIIDLYEQDGIQALGTKVLLRIPYDIRNDS